MSAPFHLVFFDVDSTLVSIEGIDVLAGGNAEVVRLTDAAMNGEIPLDEVYGRRLEMIRPSIEDIAALAGQYESSLVDGAELVIQKLLAAGCDVHLVTAGIEPAVLPLAKRLGLRESAVHAVRLFFDDGGGYVDYDRASKLVRPKGKEIVIMNARARSHGRAALIGDGVSDLEARAAVDLFIGFGGVVTRPRVREEADVFIGEASLRPLLQLLLGDQND